MKTLPTASRRALLMGFAAAATPMAPALANALSESAPAASDPIFAVIAEHREAQEALHAACKANGLDMEECPIKTAAENRAGDAELPLFTTAPTTVAGAAALLAYVGSDAHEMNQGPDDNGRPYTVLSYAAGWGADDRIDAVRRFPLHVGVALRNMIGQQTKVVQPAERDPIFAAIERERAAYADYHSIMRDCMLCAYIPYVFCVTSPFSASASRIFCVAGFGTAPLRFADMSTAP